MFLIENTKKKHHEMGRVFLIYKEKLLYSIQWYTKYTHQDKYGATISPKSLHAIHLSDFDV